MTKCTESGCRNLETKCLDCGRLVSDCKFPDEIGRIEINEYHAGMRWIDVEHAKPEDHQKILMTYNDFVMEGRYFKGKFYHPYGYGVNHFPVHYTEYGVNDDLLQEGITNWMPLPLPPM